MSIKRKTPACCEREGNVIISNLTIQNLLTSSQEYCNHMEVMSDV